MQVDSRGVNKKPTGILTNHPGLIRALSGHLCTGEHRHAILEGSRQTSKAARYPLKFAKLVARAVTEKWSGADQGKKAAWAELMESAFPEGAAEGRAPEAEAEAEEEDR
eukprot:4838047-Pyramimonas_sp.AAC.1